jgi:hypothetical protein
MQKMNQSSNKYACRKDADQKYVTGSGDPLVAPAGRHLAFLTPVPAIKAFSP